MSEDKWVEKARSINLALTLKGGIEMGDAGFDKMLTLSAEGVQILAKRLEKIAREAAEAERETIEDDMRGR